ncbi:hypothetical protein Tco_1431876, partial [Tanacetum coccineum]
GVLVKRVQMHGGVVVAKEELDVGSSQPVVKSSSKKMADTRGHHMVGSSRQEDMFTRICYVYDY